MPSPNRSYVFLALLIAALGFSRSANAQTLPSWGVPTAVISPIGNPLGVAVDSKGNIIAIDNFAGRLVVQRLDGTQFLQVPIPAADGSCGITDSSSPPPDMPPPITCFPNATSVAVDSSDLIYVADYGNDRVIVLDTAYSSTPLKALASFGTRGGPNGFGYGPTATYTPDHSSGTSDPASGGLDGAQAVDIDRDTTNGRNQPNSNHVYVFDVWNNRVVAWDCDQVALRNPANAATACHVNTALTFGDNGINVGTAPPPRFTGPQGLGVDQASGDVGVADAFGSYVDLFRYPFTGANWGWAGTIGTGDTSTAGLPGHLNFPTDVKFDAARNLWVVDNSNNRIQVFSQPTGTNPATATFTLLYQPMDGSGLIDPSGDDLSLLTPASIALDTARNRIIVADDGQDHERLEIWQPAALTASLSFDVAAPLSGQPTTATLTITNTGVVPLTDFSASISTSAGLALTPLSFMLPQTSLDGCTAAPCPSATFSIPFSISGISAVTATALVTGVHAFSGALIPANSVSASVTPVPPTNGIGITTVSVTPTPVQVNGTITVSVTLQNTGQTTVDNPTIVITPTLATCQSCAIATVASLAPGASKTWSNLTYSANDPGAPTGTASFAITATGTVHLSSTVLHATGSGSVTVKKDTSIPTIAVAVASQIQSGPNAAGWWNSALTATFTAKDPEGIAKICYSVTPQPFGVTSGCVNISGSPQTASTTIAIGFDGIYSLSFYAVDINNNKGDQNPGTALIKLDVTAPAVIFSTPTPAPNTHGWNNSPVTFKVATADNLSGLASITFGGATLTSPTITLNAQGVCVRGTVNVVDVAGNQISVQTPCTNIDMINPTMTPLTINGIVTFPPAGPAYPNGIGDPAPPATPPPAGVTVFAYQSSSVDPSTLPSVSWPTGIPVTAGIINWKICDLAGNCYTAFFNAETVNQFDPVHQVDALYARYGPTGFQPVPLVPTLINTDPKHKAQCDADGDDDDDHCVSQFSVLDGAGNGIVMLEHIQQSAGTETHVDVLGFYYVKDCPANCTVVQGVVPDGTTKKMEWSIDKKTGAYKNLNQDFTVGKGDTKIEVQANFDPKKNQTTIKRDGKNGFNVTLPGMVLLDMATKDGQIFIEYNGIRVN